MLPYRQALGAAAVAAAPIGGATAHAGPFQVDSTSTTEDVKLKSTLEHRDSKDTWIAPKLAAAFPVNERLELEASTGYRKVERDGVAHEGLGDSALKFKWRVADETPRGVAVALIPELSLPTGDEDRGLGSGHAGLVVPMVVEKHLGTVTLAGQLGYGRSFDGEDEGYVPLGVLVMVKLLDTFRLGMELAGEARADHFSDCELSTNVGLQVERHATGGGAGSGGAHRALAGL